MGKRKSRAVKIMKKAPPKVDKVFDCPYCSHSGTVEVKMYVDSINLTSIFFKKISGKKFLEGSKLL